MTNVLLIVAILNTLILIVFLVRHLQRPAVDVKPLFEQLEKNLERVERLLREEIAANRGEQIKSLQGFSSTLSGQLNALTQMNEQKLEKLREAVEQQLRHMQQDNAQKLEQMRATVDEKLQATLEKRLGESFKLVSDRLEKVHAGLGEMQNLASGVGDLKKVLTNVKTRGTWGEIQLESLLAQLLTPQQYEKNIATKRGSRDPVEFAIRLPREHGVFIPIDAKFPKEDYERLVHAQEQGNPVLVEEYSKAIEAHIKMEAKKIKDKYIDPPQTTDFALLYLPTEGLYAEVLRRPGLFEQMQKENRVIITGPTTIAAILNALQMGFRTLAVEQRASEVWTLLGSVKNEFGKFGDLLEKAQKKLESAGEEIGNAARKSRTIEKELKDVQVLSPIESSAKLLDIANP
ncbi:MAG: DNA recombination protein RmuC [Candidatus Omnitrophica bacterium]|nr:DNA recombination protein RmuC [Candidatus Omnitrophota bacterium]